MGFYSSVLKLSLNKKKNNFTNFHMGPTIMSCKLKYKEVDLEIQKTILREYQPGSRTQGPTALARLHGLCLGALRSIIKRAKLYNGNPVRERGHRKMAFMEKETRNL